MARPFDTRLPPCLSIVRLAEIWDAGVCPPHFVDAAVHYLLDRGGKATVRVFGRAFMRLGDYLEMLRWAYLDRLEDHLLSTGPDDWVRREIARNIVLGPAEVAVLAAALPAPLPAWFEGWAASPEQHRSGHGGKPSRKEDIQMAFTKLSAEQQLLRGKPLHRAICEELHPELNKGATVPGLSGEAIDRALRNLKKPQPLT